METGLSRRCFLRTASALPLITAGGLGLAPAWLRANEPVRRVGAPVLKPALNAYSFNQRLNAEIRQPGSGVTLLSLLDFCAKAGFEGIDATGYYFPGYPDVPPDGYVYEFKRRAYELGLGISATGTRNYFISADPALRAAGVRNIKAWVEVAAKLGTTVLRVFADDLVRHESWKQALPNYAHADVEAWVADALHDCAEYGRQHGVIIGVQNHGDFNGTATEFLRLIKRADSAWCAPLLDTGYFNTPDPYEDIARVSPYAVNWAVKQSVFDGGYGAEPIDLVRLIRIVRASGYRGYLPIETLAAKGTPHDPEKTTVALLAKLRAAIADTA